MFNKPFFGKGETGRNLNVSIGRDEYKDYKGTQNHTLFKSMKSMGNARGNIPKSIKIIILSYPYHCNLFCFASPRENRACLLNGKFCM